MKLHPKILRTVAAASLALAGILVSLNLPAADADEGVIAEVMKKYHKAPRGQDPIGKKAADGKASKEELKDMVAAYKKLAKTKAPQGDQEGWKKKTAALLAAAEGLQKNAPDAAAKYQDAVNCKACHSVYKPD